ncbi:MAG: hypothetical protein AB7Y46_07615 [Armatimonadota bacterium]
MIETSELLRAVFASTLALLAAASFGGWVVTLGMLMGMTATATILAVAFWVITALYGLLALAIGSVQGRRYGATGIVIAVLASLLAWLILELFYALFEIGSPQMRAPLVAGVALTIVGAVIGMQREADTRATDVALSEAHPEPVSTEDDAPEGTRQP